MGTKSRLRVHVSTYQHKGKPYAMALRHNGLKVVVRKADIGLFDRTRYISGKMRKTVQRCVDNGAVIMEYPHSPLPPWWYDGLVEIDPRVKAVFVFGRAQAEACRSFLPPGMAVFPVGFPWCKVKPFSRKKIRKILFAPIHPSGGKLRPEAREANKQIYEELLSLPRKYPVTIRSLGDLKTQGIKRKEGRVIWKRGRYDGSVREIDGADLVIAEGTFLWLAVARGKPAIGINQDKAPRANSVTTRTPASWDEWGHLTVYPHNYDPGCIPGFIKTLPGKEPREWKEACLGGPFDEKKFTNLVVKTYERYRNVRHG